MEIQWVQVGADLRHLDVRVYRINLSLRTNLGKDVNGHIHDVSEFAALALAADD